MPMAQRGMVRTRKTTTEKPVAKVLLMPNSLFFYGTEDDDALCGQLDQGLVKAMPIPGGHRFGRDYQPIVDAILQEAR
jgi:type IV secretory pathway VirJ component